MAMSAVATLQVQSLFLKLSDLLQEHSSEQCRQWELAFQRQQQELDEKFNILVERFREKSRESAKEPPYVTDPPLKTPDSRCSVVSYSDNPKPLTFQDSISGGDDRVLCLNTEEPDEIGKRGTVNTFLRATTLKKIRAQGCEDTSFTDATETLSTMKDHCSCLARRWLKCDALLEVVSGDLFTSVIAIMIAINAIVICANTDYELKVALQEFNNRGTSDPMVVDVFWTTDFVFTLLFTAELVMRLIAFQGTFFTASDRMWNVLDFAIVLISLLEVVLVGLGAELSYIRVLRLFRILRTVRMVRTTRLLVKLRTMINAIVNSVASLMWALILVLFTMIMFGAVFLQGATSYISNNIHSTDPTLLDNVDYIEEFFNSVPMTVLTLFMAITSGVSWWDIEKVLLDVGLQYGVLFLFYIAVMFLALLNIVTGIFVNDALEISQMDRDIVMRFDAERTKQYVQCLRNFFTELDVNGNGTVTYDEFKAHLYGNGPGVFSYLGLQVWDALNLFEVLDVDCNRQLEIEEFVMGCLQLRGQARTFDMVTLMRGHQQMMKKIQTAQEANEFTVARIEALELMKMDVFSSLSFAQGDTARESPRPATTCDVVTFEDLPVSHVLVEGEANFIV